MKCEEVVVQPVTHETVKVVREEVPYEIEKIVPYIQKEYE